MKKLDGHRGGHEVVGGLVARADEHEHRPQPLAAGAERPADVPLQLCAITHRHLPQPFLGALEQPAQPVAAGCEHLGDLRQAGCGREVPRRAHSASTSPAWMAMIPPAVRIQRTFTSPTAVMAAASPRASGNRRTELGR